MKYAIGDGHPAAAMNTDEPTTIASGPFETHEQSHIIYIDSDGQGVLEEPFWQSDTDARPQPKGQTR